MTGLILGAALILATSQEKVPVSPHWAFRPLEAPEPPPIVDPGIRNDIDRFIFERAPLDSAREVSPRDLVRRATVDLHGLPPTPDAIRAFEQASEPEAFESMVDKLLESPRYGERWGRH